MTASGVIRPATPADRPWIEDLLREQWHSTQVVTHGEIIDAAALPALVAEDRRGLAIWRRLGSDAELITLNAVPTGRGTGSALIEALVRMLQEQDCQRLWLTTTNDNVSALTFYLLRGFRLLHVAPGAIETPINQKLLSDPKLLKPLLENIPLHRLGKPADVAQVTAFLASDGADYITGSTIVVDGGLLWNYSEQ